MAADRPPPSLEDFDDCGGSHAGAAEATGGAGGPPPAHPVRRGLTPRERPALVGAVVAVAALAWVAVVPGPWSMMDRAQALGLAAALACSLQLSIDVGDGQRASIGAAVAIALATMLDPGAALAVTGVAVALTLPVSVLRSGTGDGVVATAWAGAASGAAIAAHAGARPLVGVLDAHGDLALLARVVVAGAGFLMIDPVARWMVQTRRRVTTYGRRRGPVAAVAGLHVAIVCAAALLVLGDGEVGGWAVLVAAAPLLIIHFSFARYARARQTYDQAVRALSVVPEVAGHAALGHGERTAFYAGVLTRALDVDGATAEAVVTAARLHHLGRILDEPGSGGDRSADPGTSAADLLSEVWFLAGVAGLVGEVESAPPGQVRLPCAIVRVASSFDELTSGDAGPVDATAAGLLARHRDPVERTVAVELVRLWEREPGLVSGAADAGRYPTSSGVSVLSEMRTVDHGPHQPRQETAS